MSSIKINESIAVLRKQKGLTQEELANRLGVTNQAVSKWESGQCCPDIQLIPKLADIFGTSIDALFGRRNEQSEERSEAFNEYSLPDDEKLRIIVFKGRKVLEKKEELSKLTFKLQGDVLNVISYCNLECGNIQNGAEARNNLSCSGSISGGVQCGNNVSCGKSISGGVQCGNNIACGVSIDGAVNCGNNLAAGFQINGDVHCEVNIECRTIKGNAECKGNIIYK